MIKDFKLGAGGDVLDLRDPLVGEGANAPYQPGRLPQIQRGSGTLVTVDSDGAVAGGVGLTITLESVNFLTLQAGGSHADIIKKLVDGGNLKTD